MSASKASSPLRLLAVIEAYSITGPARNLLEFARLAREKGVETTIATFTRGAPTNLFIDTARQSGIPVETIEERGAYDSAALVRLASIAQRLRPDILQTHAVKSHFLARRAALPELAPWVAFHHGYTWPSMKARLYNQLDRWSLRTADQVVTVSLPFRDELVAHGVRRERIEILHNAIQPDWAESAFEPSAQQALRARFSIPPDSAVILIVGRLSREKDHLSLLDAVQTLDKSLSPHLVIVGEGPERSRIEGRIRALNLTGSVTLTGQQDSAKPFYGIASVAVLSSRSEGSPNALIEAMAAGVPVVATRVGGIPEIVADEKSALLVTAGDSAAMNKAIRRLLTDRTLAQRLTVESRNLIHEKHAPEARLERLLQIYERVGQRRAAGYGKMK